MIEHTPGICPCGKSATMRFKRWCRSHGDVSGVFCEHCQPETFMCCTAEIKLTLAHFNQPG